MGYEQDAVNQMFSFTINGMALAIEVTTKLAPEVIKFFASIAKFCKDKGYNLLDEHGLVNHEIPYLKLLNRGDGGEFFAIKAKDLPKLRGALENSPVFYNVSCYDETHDDGERIYTVYVGLSDVPIVNQIIEANDIDVLKKGEFKTSPISAEQAKDMPPMPGVDDPAPQEQENSWSEFFNDSGEFQKPIAGSEDEIHPTEPGVPQSESSSGQQNKDKSQTHSPRQQAGSQTVVTEALDEMQKVKEAERAAKENAEIGTPEAENPYKSQHQLLSRMKSDCEYYLGNGNRAEKYLSEGTPAAQIAEMRRIYDTLPEKPEWLTAEQIDNYEKQMVTEVPNKNQPTAAEPGKAEVQKPAPEKAETVAEKLTDDISPAAQTQSGQKKVPIRQRLAEAKKRLEQERSNTPARTMPTPQAGLELPNGDAPIKGR